MPGKSDTFGVEPRDTVRRAAEAIRRLRAFAAAAVLAATSSGGLLAQTDAAPSYHVVRSFTLGGSGRWDYITLDSVEHRLFIARQTRVMVVDPESGKLLGEIPGLDGAHGVALDYATGHGFATSGRDGSVTMFDLGSLRVLRRTPTGAGADAVLYDPASKRVFTFNGGAQSSSVVDPVSGTLVGNVPLGGKPEFGVADGRGRLYVNLEDKAQLVEIDPSAMRVLRRWPLAPCDEPTGLAIDPVHHLLFSGCHNRLMVISDAVQGRMIAHVPIGAGVDAGAFDPSTQLAFASNGEGTITVVHEDTPTRFRVVATATTRPGARTMALDQRTHRLYTVTSAFGPPPPPTPSEPRPRPSLVPDTFSLLVLDR
jgi:DNA-binding beta-propeller fold protein YncE